MEIENVSTTFNLAWSSADSIITTYNSSQQLISDTYEGPQIITGEEGYTLVEQIPGTSYLITSIDGYYYSDFEIFDISKDMKSIFKLGQTPGDLMDIAFNTKTNRAALLGSPEEISYHLFDCDSLSILKKGGWFKQHRNGVCSANFDPEGVRIATFDWSGMLVISDVNTGQFLYNVPIGIKAGTAWKARNKCRWNPLNPLIAMCYDYSKFCLFDIERQSVVGESHSEDSSHIIRWIDCHHDGNQIVMSCDDLSLKIYDIREGKVSRAITDLHQDGIWCVRWSPCGNLLASASEEVVITDVRSPGQVFKSGQDPSGTVNSVCFMSV